jgi:hypothetical protein
MVQLAMEKPATALAASPVGHERVRAGALAGQALADAAPAAHLALAKAADDPASRVQATGPASRAQATDPASRVQATAPVGRHSQATMTPVGPTSRVTLAKVAAAVSQDARRSLKLAAVSCQASHAAVKTARRVVASQASHAVAKAARPSGTTR